MSKKLTFDHTYNSWNFILTIMLLGIFAFGSVLAVILAANAYQSINKNMDSNFEFRTPLSYISTKIKQNDNAGAIKVIKKDGIDVLILENMDDGEICETWIYEYDGSLCEVYINKGTEFRLEDGLAIIPSYGLQLNIINNLLEVRSTNHQGQTRSLFLALRSEQGGSSS
ncbi:MAG: DUF4860 domain-containing protein [Bacillota bacterium]|jgi:hypothetical protein